MTRITDMREDVKGQRSKIKVITSRRQFDARSPIILQTKVAEAPQLRGRLSLPRVTLHTSSKVKRSKVKVTRRINDLGGSSSHYLPRRKHIERLDLGGDSVHDAYPVIFYRNFYHSGLEDLLIM